MLGKTSVTCSCQACSDDVKGVSRVLVHDECWWGSGDVTAHQAAWNLLAVAPGCTRVKLLLVM